METLVPLVDEMRETARKLKHVYAENPIVNEACRRETEYKGQKVALVFSLDEIEGMTFWHLSVDPPKGEEIPEPMIIEIVRSFFPSGSVMEVPRIPLPGMERIRQFAQKI